MCVLLVLMALSGCCVLLSADASLPHAGKHRSLSTNPPHNYSSLFSKHGKIKILHISFVRELVLLNCESVCCSVCF